MIPVQHRGIYLVEYVYVINLKKKTEKTYLETGKDQTLLSTCLRPPCNSQLGTRDSWKLAWPFQAHVRVVMRAAGHTTGFGQDQERVNPDAWLPEFRLIYRREHAAVSNS
jgi:hypothetical protein